WRSKLILHLHSFAFSRSTRAPSLEPRARLSKMAPVRGIPADILALSVPMLFAGGAFSTMLYRVINVDPETTNGITPESKEAVAKGETYRHSIRQMFTGRSRSIFNNEVEVK
ncbi:hypothetical protein TSOC_005614, partial [Tetrabaena socialis]